MKKHKPSPALIAAKATIEYLEAEVKSAKQHNVTLACKCDEITRNYEAKLYSVGRVLSDHYGSTAEGKPTINAGADAYYMHQIWFGRRMIAESMTIAAGVIIGSRYFPDPVLQAQIRQSEIAVQANQQFDHS